MDDVDNKANKDGHSRTVEPANMHTYMEYIGKFVINKHLNLYKDLIAI